MGAQSGQKAFLGLGIPDTMNRDNTKRSHIRGDKGMDGQFQGRQICIAVGEEDPLAKEMRRGKSSGGSDGGLCRRPSGDCLSGGRLATMLQAAKRSRVGEKKCPLVGNNMAAAAPGLPMNLLFWALAKQCGCLLGGSVPLCPKVVNGEHCTESGYLSSLHDSRSQPTDPPNCIQAWKDMHPII